MLSLTLPILFVLLVHGVVGSGLPDCVMQDLSGTDPGDWVGSSSIYASAVDELNEIYYFGGSGGKFGGFDPVYGWLTTPGESVDLSGTDPGDWVGNSTVSTMSDSDDFNVVFLGMSDGKFGAYDLFGSFWGANTTVNLSGTDPGDWVGSSILLSSAFMGHDGVVYFGGSGGKFGAYSLPGFSEYGFLSNVSSDLSGTDTGGWIGTSPVNSLAACEFAPYKVFLGVDGVNHVFGVYDPTTNVTTDLTSYINGVYPLCGSSCGLNMVTVFCSPESRLVYVGIVNPRLPSHQVGFLSFDPVTNVTTDLSYRDVGDWLGSSVTGVELFVEGSHMVGGSVYNGTSLLLGNAKFLALTGSGPFPSASKFGTWFNESTIPEDTDIPVSWGWSSGVSWSAARTVSVLNALFGLPGDHVDLYVAGDKGAFGRCVYSFAPSNYTLTFLVRDEDTDGFINDSFRFNFISDALSFNTTSVNGSITISSIKSAEYEIQYFTPAGEYAYPRSYFTTLESNIVNESTIRLYHVRDNVSNYLVPRVVDENGLYVPGATIYLIRAQFENNSYVGYTVEMTRADSEGRGLLRVVPNTVYYKFFVDAGDKGSLATPYFKLTSNAITLQVNTGFDPLNSLSVLEDSGLAVTFNNASDTFTMNWLDASGVVSQGCLVVVKYSVNGVRSVYSESCSAGPVGSIAVVLNDTNHTRYVGTGTVYLPGGGSRADVAEANYQVGYSSIGLLGVLMTLLVVLFLVGLAGGSAEGVVMAGVFGIVLMGLVGFLFYSWLAVVGIIIIGGVIVYKMNKGP